MPVSCLQTVLLPYSSYSCEPTKPQTLTFHSIFSFVSTHFLLSVGRLEAFIISSSSDAAFITFGIAVAPAGSDLTGINDNDRPARHPHQLGIGKHGC